MFAKTESHDGQQRFVDSESPRTELTVFIEKNSRVEARYKFVLRIGDDSVEFDQLPSEYKSDAHDPHLLKATAIAKIENAANGLPPDLRSWVLGKLKIYPV